MTHTNVFTQNLAGQIHTESVSCFMLFLQLLLPYCYWSKIHTGHLKQCNSSDIQYHSSETLLFMGIITHMGQV